MLEQKADELSCLIVAFVFALQWVDSRSDAQLGIITAC
jgi:hypothetical protein